MQPFGSGCGNSIFLPARIAAAVNSRKRTKPTATAIRFPSAAIAFGPEVFCAAPEHWTVTGFQRSALFCLNQPHPDSRIVVFEAYPNGVRHTEYCTRATPAFSKSRGMQIRGGAALGRGPLLPFSKHSVSRYGRDPDPDSDAIGGSGLL